MYNYVTRKNIQFFPYSLPTNVAYVRKRIRTSTKVILVLSVILLVLLMATVQVSAQTAYREFFESGNEDSYVVPTATDQVTIGVRVMDNLSLKMIDGEPTALTNFKWGASVQKEIADPQTTLLYASVNF
ncbi:MAG: hypothetical protein V1685_07065 [Parcubacteria group bacterium]